MAAVDLRKEFREAEKLWQARALAPAAQQGGKVLEAFLRQLCRELLLKLSGGEAANLNYAIDRVGKGKPLDRLTLGELAQVIYEAQVVPRAEKLLKMDLKLLRNAELVRSWVDLRNRASHAESEISEEEVEAFLANLRLGLQDAGILKKPVTLKHIPSWWEVVKPHRDIREGRIEASLFAAKLDEVVAGRAHPEYQDPKTFFSHTVVTWGLRQLLAMSAKRLSGKGGDGVLHIETPFGGGKTHSLIALYHLFRSPEAVYDQSWAQDLREELGAQEIPKAKVLTFVGTEADPFGPSPWGVFGKELGKYELVRQADESRQAPGKKVLRELLGEEPVLILVDEIAEFLCKVVEPGKVSRGEEGRAYQSQILAFMHELTELASELPRCLLVLTTTTSTAYGEEGERVQQHLRNLVSRMHRLYEPVGSQDIYEVVRARLFEDLGDPETHEAVAHELVKLYGEQSDLPEEAQDPGYREKIARAYPFHPELIDVLYNQWGSFPGFQRTRGVLRFLALVVQEAWKKREEAGLIHPGDVPLGNREVRRALLEHIGGQYETVIACDIVGGQELARRIDRNLPEEIRKLRLAERLATTIFMYSFSGAQKAERGTTASRIRLSILSPKVPSSPVRDVLGQLEDSLLYLHKRNNRYFFSTELNLTRAIVEAESAVEENQIREEVRRALEKRVGSESPITGREIWPDSPERVPEYRDRHALVILSPDYPYGAEKTIQFVKALYLRAGEGYRASPGALLVLAPDSGELATLRNNVRRLLALREIERTRLKELTPEDQENLNKRRKDTELAVSEGVLRVWRHLALWQGAEDVEWIPLVAYARANLSLASMVIEHLQEANRLSEKLAPALLFELVPIKEKRGYKELWAAFLCTPRMPIVPERAVREAVKEGVRQGLVGLDVDGEIYFQRDVPDALLEEAVVIPAAEAEALVAPKPTPSDAKQEEPRPPSQPGTPTIQVKEKPQPTRYRVRAKVSWDRFGDFFRGVIGPLKESADTLEVEIEVRAWKETGLPEDVLEHKVRETLRQLKAEILEEEG